MPNPTLCKHPGCDRPKKHRGYCGAHYQRFMSGRPMDAPLRDKRHGTLAERFWRKVNKAGPIPTYAPQLGPCWIWTGYIQKNGYAKMTVEADKCYLAHRLAWILTYGREPEPEIDHLCRVKHCVNPTHMEEVTHSTNQKRSWASGEHRSPPRHKATHCKNGHEFTPENTYLPPDPSGLRQCRVCRRAAIRRRAERERATRLKGRGPTQPS